MTVYMAYVSFIVFVVLLLLVNSYFLISLRIEKRKNDKIEKRKEIIKQDLIDVLEKNNINKQEKINKLKLSFNRKTDTQAFYYAVKEYQSTHTNKEELTHLLEEVVNINKILKSGVVRKEYKESYTLYLLSEFGLGNQEAGEFALASLNKKSLHVRNNALNVINKNEDITIMMRAIDMINNKNYYFNDKMIIDFLDNYIGDMNQLDEKLYLKMDGYNISLQKNMISHFMNRNNGEEKVRVKMLDLIQISDEKEMIISGIRYFNKIIDQRAKEPILKNMRHSNWIIRATSVRVISKYTGKEIITQLKETLTDENYYVRFNSAESFLKLADRETVIKEAIRNEDRFARDILLYAMNIRGMITVEEYQQLVDEDQATKRMEGVVAT
ncbi:HEAT repeat domain-containing protein [Jeotgalibaca sp. MA1X17-3]|uniref:HEAT repeat domain-containing protein n=1 Tax=Jeotgalibaca sp. MA1X17-3 TaxID=2908211 RepID=UPI001F1B38B7|nr:HEAT repeat domain-containing protein [Jeotgalibaca sp. MA1X17-3]UJF15411.1 HEAT repeat domain-containing protein [Jeotgalibaca sp. MA1X17-3]